MTTREVRRAPDGTIAVRSTRFPCADNSTWRIVYAEHDSYYRWATRLLNDHDVSAWDVLEPRRKESKQ